MDSPAYAGGTDSFLLLELEQTVHNHLIIPKETKS